MNILFDRLSAWFHRVTGNTEAQVQDVKDFNARFAQAPKGSHEEASYFCMAEEQLSSLAGKNFESDQCYRSFRQFQTVTKMAEPLLKGK